MATEGKHSPLTIKAMAYSTGGFLVAWGATKLLDTYLDTTLLTTMKGWLLRAWSWSLLDTPMPNWSLLMLVVALFSTLSITIYYYRTTDRAYGDLYEAEQTIYKLRNPEAPELSHSQIGVLMCLADFFEGGSAASLAIFGDSPHFNCLERELDLEQLKSNGYVQFANPAGTTTSTRKPALTSKGKKFVLARRKKDAELAEQKAKTAKLENTSE